MCWGVPTQVEEIPYESRVGEVFNLRGVEEDSQVRVLEMGVVSFGVVGVINQFDLLDELSLGLVKVGVGSVDDYANGAGLGH